MATKETAIRNSIVPTELSYAAMRKNVLRDHGKARLSHERFEESDYPQNDRDDSDDAVVPPEPEMAFKA